VHAPEELRTARLIGLKPTLSDITCFRILDANPAVQATLFGRPRTLKESQERLRTWIAHWDNHGFGEWIFRLETGTFVGTCGLFRDTIDGTEVVALGYVLDERFWGRGYATEVARAALSVAFKEMHLSDVYAVIDPANGASRRVLEKTGFEYVRDFIYRENWPSALFRATPH
jgi:RimJ/RimL family protein N-acetyltransferase